ncbi:hypothetical protein G6F24_017418 [Rhizopus arrhizus]|nr:hypothetical protein G6F24_017418 [Rhizopus arrhizus]
MHVRTLFEVKRAAMLTRRGPLPAVGLAQHAAPVGVLDVGLPRTLVQGRVVGTTVFDDPIEFRRERQVFTGRGVFRNRGQQGFLIQHGRSRWGLRTILAVECERDYGIRASACS